MRARDFLVEYRGGILRLLQQEFPGWPDYVVRDFLLGRMNKAVLSGYPITKDEAERAKILSLRGDGSIDVEKYREITSQEQEKKWAQSLRPHIKTMQNQYPVKRWEKKNVHFTWDKWDASTQSKLADMAGEDPAKLANMIPRHTKRIGTQDELLKRLGVIKEPIIVMYRGSSSINDPQQGGFELIEGHHRVVSILRAYGVHEGFWAPAWIGYL
jgi:hypothetical protein